MSKMLKDQRKPHKTTTKRHKTNPKRTQKSLHLRYDFLLIFFTFQALLNYVPFELAQILGAHSRAKTGALYAGYALGVLISFVVCAFSLAFAIMLAKTRVYGVRNEN